MEIAPKPDESPKRLARAWYDSSIAEFCQTAPDAIIGRLAINGEFALLPTQKEAWLAQIELLQRTLANLTGHIFLEFNIPRMGRRIDAVILIGPVVFVIEFKVGEKTIDRAAIDQVWDYALDLKNFHLASHTAPIVPILIPTALEKTAHVKFTVDADHVYRPITTHPEECRKTIELALQKVNGASIDSHTWGIAPYRPTPTIIEAARNLYAQHSVAAIARYDAGAKNLSVTSQRVEQLVDQAKKEKLKLICFVTGVPGAGKTLVGLNIATQHRDETRPTHAVFLSGNGPLVAVLREALTRDEVSRQAAKGQKTKKGRIHESVKAFIQNVHHFRDEALVDTGAPSEHVVIFDEAQRAWNLKQTANFMRRKRNHTSFGQSEPEFLISYMDRHQDWAVIVCLVGGGQEINTGEAGIGAWLDAVNLRFPHWHMYISANLTDSEYAAETSLESLSERKKTFFDDSLHLSVSMRSFRAENVSYFVKSLLDCDISNARDAFRNFSRNYPIVVTRDLSSAKQWVREHARGTERYGLLASSKAQRLKPHAIDIRVDIDPVNWFLNGRDDTRSSYYLEDAATEFHVQGLELDWTCLSWDGDLRFSGAGWSYNRFRGTSWCQVGDANIKNYLRNAYRVLLTRARQGMVIFVPAGDSSDSTRKPEFYDETYKYLADLGIPEVG